jgi:hypothetical protein
LNFTTDLASIVRVRVRVVRDETHHMAQPLVLTTDLASLFRVRVRVVWEDRHHFGSALGHLYRFSFSL